jgi:hypothetical protein
MTATPGTQSRSLAPQATLTISASRYHTCTALEVGCHDPVYASSPPCRSSSKGKHSDRGTTYAEQMHADQRTDQEPPVVVGEPHRTAKLITVGRVRQSVRDKHMTPPTTPVHQQPVSGHKITMGAKREIALEGRITGDNKIVTEAEIVTERRRASGARWVSVTVKCQGCENVITRSIRPSKQGKPRFCSEACNARYWRRIKRHKIRICTVCGTSFTATRPDAGYCSDACRQKAYRAGKSSSAAASPTSEDRLLDSISPAT